VKKAGISFLSLGINILSLALPLALLQVYDRIVPSQSYGSAIVIFAGTALALIGAGFLRYVRSAAFARLGAKAGHVKTLQSARALLGQKGDRASKRRSLNALAQARDADVGQGKIAYYDGPFAVIFLLLVWYLGDQIVLAPLALIAIVFVFLLLQIGSYRRRIGDLASAKADVEEAISASVTRTHNSATLQSVGPSLFDLLKLKRIEAAAAEKLDRLNAALVDIQQSAGLAITVAIVGVGAFSVLDGTMTTGGLAACTLLGSRGANQLLGVLIANFRHQAVKVAVGHAKPGSSEKSHVSKPDLSKGYLVFSPEGDASQVSQFHALVDGGGEHIHHVPRLPKLMYGTILQNISSFQSEYESRARDVARAIGLDHAVADLPDGYFTEVGHQASSPISQGVTKLIALTHALATSDAILAFEDPSFSLDKVSVEGLVKVLIEQKDDRTIVALTAEPALQKLEAAAEEVVNG